MSNNPSTTTAVEEEFENEDIGADDYGFIIGPDGNLKTLMIPEHLMEDPPEEVQAILEIFGIEDIHDIEDKIIH
jgi:hypothetical protein